MLSRRIGWISHLQLIVLPSLTLEPANVIHLWIEEGLIYTVVCQAFGFSSSCSCCKGVFGRTEAIEFSKWPSAQGTINSRMLLYKVTHCYNNSNRYRSTQKSLLTAPIGKLRRVGKSLLITLSYSSCCNCRW